MLGPVFRGYDPDQDRVVAIKAFVLDLTPEQAADLAAEFDRLAERAIPHGFIILPLAGGADGSTAFLAEEYFVAESTDVALKQYGPPPLADALRLIGQLAGAIDAAAAAGVHHGALHPRDVLVAPHEMRLTGLGIVPALERVGFRPQARIPYAAPERMLGKPATHLSDVFSLACVSFELLTGRRPVPSGDTVSVETSGIRAADASALSEVFARVLSDRPEDRYVSALAFAAALKHALTGAPLQGGVEVETAKPRRAARARQAAVLPFEEETQAPESAAPVPGPAPARRQRPPRTPSAPDASPSLLDESDATAGRESELAPAGRESEVAPAVETPPDTAAVSAPAPAQTADVVEEPVAVSEPVRPMDGEPGLEPVPEPEPAVDVVEEPVAVSEPVRPMDGEPGLEPVPEPEAEFEPVAESPADVVAAAVPVEISASAPAFEPEPTVILPPATEPEPIVVLPPPTEPEPIVVLSPPAEPEPDRGEEPTFSTYSAEAAEPLVAAPPGRNLAALLGMLAVGLVIGFVAGYLVAPRGAPTPPAAPAASVPALAPPAAAAASTPAAQPTTQPTPSPAPPAASPAGPAAVAKAPDAAAPAAPIKAARGTLVITSRPAGARVLVDGRDAGKTPLTLRQVKAGSHTIRLERAGYRPWTLTVRVTAGGRRNVTASLRRLEGR